MKPMTRAEMDEQLHEVWYALYQVSQETEDGTWGKPGYDMRLDHLHDVANAARETLDDVRAAVALLHLGVVVLPS